MDELPPRDLRPRVYQHGQFTGERLTASKIGMPLSGKLLIGFLALALFGTVFGKAIAADAAEWHRNQIERRV